MRYVVAFYELDLCHGGPEEGGWWYTSGELVRVFCVCKSESNAYAKARRANTLLACLQRSKPELASTAYRGGRYGADVFEHTAPKYFPEKRPRYE
jgi:hypothetical protein